MPRKLFSILSLAMLVSMVLSPAIYSQDDSTSISNSSPEEAQPASPPGITTQWPKGRGFGVGQTVPDIPLYDMKGNEVRFSRYLGKQYILYVWASW